MCLPCLVIVAAAIGAIAALQPWSSSPEQISSAVPAEVAAQAPETSMPIAVEQPVEFEPAVETEAAGTEKSDVDSKRLSLAVNILKSLNTRMTALEEQVGAIEQDLEGSRLNMAQNQRQEREPEEERIDDEQPTSTELASAQARQAYFQDIEQSIVDGFDEWYSQEITDSYASLLATGEAWTKGVSVNPTECGDSYCKVVVNLPADMDSQAQFELDGRLYMQVSSMLPESKSEERQKPDGTKEILIYFAKKDAQFPRLPE